MDPRGLALLVPRHDKATTTGTQIHTARATEHHDLREAVRITSLEPSRPPLSDYTIGGDDQ